MDELHRITDKFERESDLLIHMLEGLEHDQHPDAVELTLSVAKRVRRESNLVVRAIARLRDQLQP